VDVGQREAAVNALVRRLTAAWIISVLPILAAAQQQAPGNSATGGGAPPGGGGPSWGSWAWFWIAIAVIAVAAIIWWAVSATQRPRGPTPSSPR
jgi:hypothetical protein